MGRMDRNGVIMFDALRANSTMWDTAAQRSVKLIQMRNNHPVEELRQHLHSLRVSVQAESISTEEVKKRVMEMPLQVFID